MAKGVPISQRVSWGAVNGRAFAGMCYRRMCVGSWQQRASVCTSWQRIRFFIALSPTSWLLVSHLAFVPFASKKKAFVPFPFPLSSF